MGRVLCAWEFGGDLGHIRRLAALGGALRRIGHEPLVAAGNLVHAAPVLGDIEWHQAPLIVTPPMDRPPLSATDVLVHMGLAQAEALAAALRGWQCLIGITQPAVLVGDYAPVALLAARAAGIPSVNIGSGFSLPPRADPMPSLRDWMAIDPAVLRGIDDELLAAVNGALRASGASPLESAGAIFDSDLELLCTFPGIDPFGPRPGAEYLGPLDESSSGAEPRWQGPGSHVLAYLKPRYSHFAAVVKALGELPGEAIVAAPGLFAESAATISTDRVRVLTSPVNLAALLPETDLCIGHGGAGFAGRALGAGVPQAMLPMQLEQFLVARRIEALGAGATMIEEELVPDLPAWFSSLLGNAAMREAARRSAPGFAGHDARASADRAAARVASLVR